MKKKVIAGLIVVGTGLLGGVIGNSLAPKVEPLRYMDLMVGATEWQLGSGEVMALQYQAYNTAEKELESSVKDYTGNKKLAVVLDLDETVINNYGNTIENILSREGYSKEKFTAWAKQEKAPIIAGADDFLHKAEELGVEIYYVSNRYPEDLDATIENLKKLGLPSADKEHILIKTDSSNKAARVEEISKTHDIAMFVGDNLGDFPSDFYKKSNEERKDIVNKEEDKFGTKYIILPNASYGDWEGATFGYDFKKSEGEKIATFFGNLQKRVLGKGIK